MVYPPLCHAGLFQKTNVEHRTSNPPKAETSNEDVASLSHLIEFVFLSISAQLFLN